MEQYDYFFSFFLGFHSKNFSSESALYLNVEHHHFFYLWLNINNRFFENLVICKFYCFYSNFYVVFLFIEKQLRIEKNDLSKVSIRWHFIFIEVKCCMKILEIYYYAKKWLYTKRKKKKTTCKTSAFFVLLRIFNSEILKTIFSLNHVSCSFYCKSNFARNLNFRNVPSIFFIPLIQLWTCQKFQKNETLLD